MTDNTDLPRRRPAAIRLDEPQATTETARTEPVLPRKPAAFDERLAEIAENQDIFDDALPPAVPARRRRAPFASIALSGAGVLVSLGIGLWIDGLVADLFARAEWLGYVALGAAILPCSASPPLRCANSWACAASPSCRTSRPISPPSASRHAEDGTRRDRPPCRLPRPPPGDGRRPRPPEGGRR